jgi:molybdopterin synthase sulfur carrier subunit
MPEIEPLVMPILRIPAPLRSYTSGFAEVTVQGCTVDEAMQDLVRQYPSLQPQLYNQQGRLRHFVNLFLGENNIKDLQGLDTPLEEADRLLLIHSIAGGSVC